MTTTGALDRARDTYGRHDWAAAYAQLAALDRGSPLAPADLERLAMAAFLVGRDDDAAGAWARAFQGWHGRRRRGAGRPVRVLAGPEAPAPR
jgi:hypothetical protein